MLGRLGTCLGALDPLGRRGLGILGAGLRWMGLIGSIKQAVHLGICYLPLARMVGPRVGCLFYTHQQAL